MLYFDHAATTPPSSAVLDTYIQVAQQYFANPSSAHLLGQEAHHLLNNARQQIANLLHFERNEIYFTSSGTESNNWVLQSLLSLHADLHPDKKQVILSAIEHPSIRSQIDHLQTSGFEVILAPVDQNGQIDLIAFKELLNDKVLLVSTMLVNNEMGALLPIEQMAESLSDYPQILWHIDAVQAITCRMKWIHQARIDLLTLSSHKFHAVRGVGLMAIRQRVNKAPLLFGGGQEFGQRSSTENLPAIVATAKALRLAWEVQEESLQRLTHYRDQVTRVLSENNWRVFGGKQDQISPHIICAAFPGVPGEVLLQAFSNAEIMISTTSACSSRKKNDHHTLKAMGVEDRVAQSSVRFSFSQKTNQIEIDLLTTKIKEISAKFMQDLKGV
ncbi:cysteine desulfurase family protein [Facklamia miroungae]|uniref:Cysteine desulfurase n=1 Tax=Facklamia miroungae TaxID=120956 RepID=A0A1G7TX85_9LACT|nr:cysteine desulfurase family protein [Facklamia miroungae]NKZ29984.1 cysteine desulfurase [Facklamia miroungae]SDG39140.1 cysteine desulfurase [Facklamia miroungae]